MTDPILKKATELTKHTKPRYHPIPGRIAYVVSHGQSYASNGYAIRTHGIAKALNGHGLETLCFVRPGRPWDMGIAKNTVTPEMQVDGVRYIHSRWPGDKKPDTEEQKFTATINRLVELFTVYRPQVVIAASNHEIALPALVAARQLGLPFQYEVRGFWEVSRASRDPAWENSPEYQEHYNRECWVISRADQLYTLNSQMKEELVARGAKPEQIDLVPNSVSGMPRIVKQSNVRQQYGIPNDAYVLGYMGAITEYEGLDHLLEALKLLKKEKVFALIVGGYSPVNRLGRAKPEPIVQKLQKLAKSYGIHKQVIFTGRVDHDKLPEYFAAVDATVIPRASLPVCELVSAIKPLEYLSYGKPLIASNVAPQAEVLEHGKLGWLYEKGNAQALAETVQNVRAQKPQNRSERTSAGLIAVEHRYHWSKTTAVVAQKLHSTKEVKNGRPKIACIMDDFTYQSYAPEADFYQLTPENWEAELNICQPDMLFVESAWRGKDELWGRKVGHKSQEVQGIVNWCNENDVPTMFWNKEDPVHFETFLNTAKLFDNVFTTDLDCIHRYKGALGHNNVYFLPFACQPKLTNPIETYERKNAFCFAGAYYVRYPDRTKDLETFVEEFPKFRPLEIYDRNYGKDDPNYQFPDNYQPYIVGTLPFSEIDKAYKGYRYAINLNSIKQSQTMFARRVYELLGSNTITVSNFSRGIRLMFGELVLTSDSGAEIVNRLESMESNGLDADKFRLAGLRKVLSEHTYQARLDYILSKVLDRSHRHPLAGYTVISKVGSDRDVEITLENFNRQNHKDKHLVLIVDNDYSLGQARMVATNRGEPNGAEYHSLQSLGNGDLETIAKSGTWIAAFSANDYYGPNYLLDLALATRFSDAPVIGKAAFYQANTVEPELQNADCAYKEGSTIPVRSGAIAPRGQTAALKLWVEGIETAMLAGESTQSIDPFNYARNLFANDEVQAQRAAVQSTVDDVKFDEGIPLEELIELAENTQPKGATEEQIPSYSAGQLDEIFSNPGSETVHTKLTDDGIVVTSSLSDGKHEYIYLKSGNEVPLDELLAEVEDKSRLPLHLEMTPGLNLSLVAIFFDADGNRLYHNIVPANKNSETEIHKGAEKVRFGYRVYQSGQSTIKKLMIGKKDLSPETVLGRSDVLLVTNHYPSYDDLYRNGFVHTRVKAYQERGVDVDVFRFRKDQPVSWHEFQKIDVITGSNIALHRMLASGTYRHVLVHFLDPNMWDVLKRFIGDVKVTVWIHGAEIQPWWRREYNYKTEEELAKAKKLSAARLEFWQRVLDPMPENLKLIFVSQYFANEVMEDLKLDLPKDKYAIIHNPVDVDIFSYQKKNIEQRKRVLSIRPYASRKYANDLSVKAVIELSKEDFFDDLEFLFVGDGVLFDEILQPIKNFPNVKIERGFLSQIDIAKLHKEYGVFLCPTRMDAQGVSKDEAMSSGLVVVTNGVTAIPEFVDASCGILADGEDYVGMAEGIKNLYAGPELFQRLSKAAHERVVKQVAKGKVVNEEVSSFRGGGE